MLLRRSPCSSRGASMPRPRGPSRAATPAAVASTRAPGASTRHRGFQPRLAGRPRHAPAAPPATAHAQRRRRLGASPEQQSNAVSPGQYTSSSATDPIAAEIEAHMRERVPRPSAPGTLTRRTRTRTTGAATAGATRRGRRRWGHGGTRAPGARAFARAARR